MLQARYFHAGCPVCVDAEQTLLHLLDNKKIDVEIVHLGEQKSRVAEAEKAGVQSVPALLIDGQVLHLNFGAPLSALK